jgi:hypothetical protein
LEENHVLLVRALMALLAVLLAMLLAMPSGMVLVKQSVRPLARLELVALDPLVNLNCHQQKALGLVVAR